MSTDVTSFIEDLYAGVFSQKLSAALSDCAARTIEHERKSKITLTFDISQIGQSHQVAVRHMIAYSYPTKNGDVTTKDKTETPMYVGERGKLTLYPERQGMLFDKKGHVHSIDKT